MLKDFVKVDEKGITYVEESKLYSLLYYFVKEKITNNIDFKELSKVVSDFNTMSGIDLSIEYSNYFNLLYDFTGSVKRKNGDRYISIFKFSQLTSNEVPGLSVLKELFSRIYKERSLDRLKTIRNKISPNPITFFNNASKIFRNTAPNELPHTIESFKRSLVNIMYNIDLYAVKKDNGLKAQQTVLQFYGAGGTGKTKLMDDIFYVFEELGIPSSVIDLNTKSNFTNESFFTKYAVRANDPSMEKADCAKFNEIIDNAKCEVEYKGQDRSTDMSKATLFICSNTKCEGRDRRYSVVNFVYPMEEIARKGLSNHITCSKEEIRECVKNCIFSLPFDYCYDNIHMLKTTKEDDFYASEKKISDMLLGGNDLNKDFSSRKEYETGMSIGRFFAFAFPRKGKEGIEALVEDFKKAFKKTSKEFQNIFKDNITADSSHMNRKKFNFNNILLALDKYAVERIVYYVDELNEDLLTFDRNIERRNLVDVETLEDCSKIYNKVCDYILSKIKKEVNMPENQVVDTTIVDFPKKDVKEEKVEVKNEEKKEEVKKEPFTFTTGQPQKYDGFIIAKLGDDEVQEEEKDEWAEEYEKWERDCALDENLRKQKADNANKSGEQK